MGRISQYPLDTDIQGNDKWIGTSVSNANATKNFSVDTVAEYLNKSAALDSQNLRYTYQNVQGDDVRLASTISFIPSLGDNVSFDDITEWVISAYAKQIKDVRTYYDAPLVGKTILITNAFNPSNWAIFRWDSVVEDIDDPNFYHIGLTHIQSTGGLEVNQDYLIALLDASSGGGGSAIWGDITGTLSAQTDLQTALDAKQDDLVSGTNIKTINGVTLLGSGDITITTSTAWGSITGTLSSQTDLQSALNGKQASLVSGTNIQSINGSSILTSGDLSLQTPLVSGTSIKTINSTSLLGSGDIAVQPTLVSGTNIKTINSTSLLGSGDIVISASPSGVAGAVQFSNGSAFASDAANLFFNDTNNRLGVGTNSPLGTVHFKGSTTSNLDYSIYAENLTGGRLLAYTNDGRLGLNLNPSATLHSKSTGSTNATQSFKAENSTAAKYMQFDDAGQLGINVVPTATVHTKGSGNTSATINLKSENLGGTASFNHYGDGTWNFIAESAVKWSMRDTFYELVAGNSLSVDRYITRTFQFGSNLSSTRFDGMQIINGAGTLSMNATSGNYRLLSMVNNHQTASAHAFNPTSGNATLTHIQINTDIQQSGTATGRVVGIDYTPTLTSITGTHYGILIRPTTFNGFGLGTTLPTATVHIKGSGTTTSTKSLQIENNNSTKQVLFDDAGNLMTNGSMAIGQTTPPSSTSILELVSTTQGFLPPRMTTTQINAISTPANGLMVYNTTIDHICVYQAGAWVKLSHSPM